MFSACLVRGRWVLSQSGSWLARSVYGFNRKEENLGENIHEIKWGSWGRLGTVYRKVQTSMAIVRGNEHLGTAVHFRTRLSRKFFLGGDVLVELEQKGGNEGN